MGRLVDLTGQKFGKLTVIEKVGIAKHGDHAKWLCQCECGKTIITLSNSLRQGKTLSCGCIRIECAMCEVRKRTKHGLSKERLYNIWYGMIDRCTHCNCDRYADYGGRGITVCAEWLHDFQAFYDWSMANGYKDNLTIDRIDVNGNYEPSNCRWATYKEQANNTRKNHLITYNGKTQTMTQWAETLKINYGTLSSRIRRGWSVKKAFTQSTNY